MKIYDIINEAQVASNKIIDAILKNSNLSDSTNKEQYIPEINKLYNRFRQIQNQLNPNLPQVYTFLRHFDGEHGEKKFEGDLKDITKYSLKQLKFLIDEYTTDSEDDGENVVQNRELLNKTQYNDETAELSKKLWYDESKAKINLPGFRVYQPMNQSDALKYGWYEEKMMNEIRPGHHAWCITWRSGQNRWEYYRKQGGTFYFIIDESKLQSSDSDVRKYYLCALQVFQNKRPGHRGYEITDIKNPGEKEVSWSELVSIYPQLSEFQNEITPLEFSQDELQLRSVTSNINEDSGNPQNFARVPRRYKLEYINLALKISKPESWYSMDKDLRERYIVLTNRGEYTYRFPNFELLRAVKKTGFGKLLDDTIRNKEGNEGIKSLSEYLMRDLNPLEERAGIKNPNIILYKTRKNRYGLWNNTSSDWLEKNNNMYEPSYTKTEENIIENPKTKEKFYVDKFEVSDGDYFMAITEIHDIDSYFLSKNAWENIQDKFSIEPIEIDVEKSQDIFETKKGV
jgi:hypothetical protein